MGKIFGICDNPVSSTIESSLRIMDSVPKPTSYVLSETKLVNKNDMFVSNINKNVKSNKFIKMRNGIGKLMSYFKK